MLNTRTWRVHCKDTTQIQNAKEKEGKSHLFLKCRILNFINMQQRILTFTKRFKVMDQYGMNLDAITDMLNKEGWVIKQIVSTTFEHQLLKDGVPDPVLVITLLVEKA